MSEQEQQPESEENPFDRMIAQWRACVNLAVGGTLVYVEGFTCPKCNFRQFACHIGAEVLTCGKCNTKTNSTAPLKPVRGEKQVAHMQLAINSLFTASQDRLALLPPLAPSELSELDSKTRILLARYSEQVKLETLQMVNAMGNQLAEIDD